MKPALTRRSVLGGLGATLALPALARAAQPLDAEADFGVVADSLDDQSSKLQAALDAAQAQGRTLLLPGGQIVARELDFPAGVHVTGQPGRTVLFCVGDAPVARAALANGMVLEDIGFSGGGQGAHDGLLVVDSSVDVTLRHCSFLLGVGSGLLVTGSGATIDDCTFDQLGDAAVHALDSKGLTVRGNRITRCGSAGIRIWRSESGHDGSIISGNHISTIDWQGGGNGQNGNGINVYRANEVVVTDNVITDCAFTAVRVNGGRNTQVRGNTCLNSGEVAIFSEFEFSGSIVSDNIIDGAATGISITNLDSGGYLATCTGNLVRNIAPRSEVNPDTRPVGIYAEADTVVADNAVENVPGVGIAAGYGPYLRNVNIVGNVVTKAQIGIGVSVVQENSPGAVRVSGNLISGAQQGIAGLEWEKMVSDDLARDADRYPNVTISDNTIG